MTVRDLIERYGTGLAGLLLFVVFAAVAPRFLDPTNLLNVLKHASVTPSSICRSPMWRALRRS